MIDDPNARFVEKMASPSGRFVDDFTRSSIRVDLFLPRAFASRRVSNR